MRHRLTVIEGGMRPCETARSKLISRPFDYPEEVFKRLSIEAGSTLPLAELIEIVKLRQTVLEARQASATPATVETGQLGYERIPAFLLDSAAVEDAPSPP